MCTRYKSWTLSGYTVPCLVPKLLRIGSYNIQNTGPKDTFKLLRCENDKPVRSLIHANRFKLSIDPANLSTNPPIQYENDTKEAELNWGNSRWRLHSNKLHSTATWCRHSQQLHYQCKIYKAHCHRVIHHMTNHHNISTILKLWPNRILTNNFRMSSQWLDFFWVMSSIPQEEHIRKKQNVFH